MLKYLHRTVIALVSGFILAGCSSTPPPVTSGYLSDYHRLKPGTYLEEFWIDTGQVIKSEPPSIVLGEISAPGITDKEDVTVANCISWLTTGLLAGAAISDNKPDAGYRLDVAITYMDPGSASARILAGEFGAGHAKVQTEGKIIDINSGALIATFAERRRSSGAIGMDDLAGDSETGLIELMIKSISKDVNSELLSTFSL